MTALFGVLAVASALGGCANNITGFDFPVFGLTKKSADQTPTADSGGQDRSSPRFSYQ